MKTTDAGRITWAIKTPAAPSKPAINAQSRRIQQIIHILFYHSHAIYILIAGNKNKTFGIKGLQDNNVLNEEVQERWKQSLMFWASTKTSSL